jgi:nucleotidyltransferase substrate binding protein (TIGR01987 family)
MDTKQLDDAIVRLEEMLREYAQADKLEPLLKDAVKESLIQRFEYTHEIAWKTAKRYLVEIEGYKSEIGPNSVIRLCAELGLLDAEPWLAYASARQNTSHDYSGTKASLALESVNEFFGDVTKFHAALKQRIGDKGKSE